MKNRRKNGDYYWDIASVTPLREGGTLSVRTRPSVQQIRETEALYQKLREGSDSNLRLSEGRPYRLTWRYTVNPLRKWSDQSNRFIPNFMDRSPMSDGWVGPCGSAAARIETRLSRLASSIRRPERPRVVGRRPGRRKTPGAVAASRRDA